MGTLIMIAQLILGLSILVFIHELGHYLAARAFKIKVEKFYLFFDAWGFKLFKYKKGDTEYGIGWLPFGGYVKIAGMIDESLDKKAMKLPPQPWEFRSKPAWQRLIVMVAGVVMNLILGIIIFTAVILHYEKVYLPTAQISEGIYAFPAGREIGFVTGDKIIKLNGKNVERFKDVTSANVIMGATLTVDRGGKIFDVIVPDTLFKIYNKNIRDFFIDAQNYEFAIDSILPGKAAEKADLKKNDKIISLDSIIINSFGSFRENMWNFKGKNVVMGILRDKDTLQLSVQIDTNGTIGIGIPRPHYKLKEYTLASGIRYGVKDAMGNLWANVRGLGKIFSGKASASESIQGPIGIMKIYGELWDWHRFWVITGLISVVLAFMNILPIPALDGGHVIFTTWELVTRRKVSEKILERAQVVGMILLIALMVFAVFNDVWKNFIR